VIKRQVGLVKVRFRSLQKNTAQLLTLFALWNVWMARRQLRTGLAVAVFLREAVNFERLRKLMEEEEFRRLPRFHQLNEALTRVGLDACMGTHLRSRP